MTAHSRLLSNENEGTQYGEECIPGNLKVDKFKKYLDILSYREMQELKEPGWLIEGVLHTSSAALLFGESNSFKSTLVIDLACHVAFATKLSCWHGCPMYVGDDQPLVLYVATEGGIGVAKKRIPGWCDHNGIPTQFRENIYLYPQEISLDSKAEVSRLIDSVKRISLERVADLKIEVGSRKSSAFCLLVFDIYGATMEGSEVADDVAREWVRQLNRVQRELGCATLTVAHSGYSEKKRARMHSHTWGSFDTRLMLVGNKYKRTAALTVDRHKDADSKGAWNFKFDVVENASGDTTLVPLLLTGSAETSAQLSEPQRKALNALHLLTRQSGSTSVPVDPTKASVELLAWRKECSKIKLSSVGNANAENQAFKRAKKDLLSKELIREVEGRMSLTEAGVELSSGDGSTECTLPSRSACTATP